ncbi:MAG: hypothetical protein ACMUEM_01230 [Flavobacteriales bacterium AspAUS03]
MAHRPKIPNQPVLAVLRTIRALMTFGIKPLAGKDHSSLKVLGTVGDPINSQA